MIRPDYSNINFIKPIADLSAMRLNLVAKATKRIARKKGQHRNSPSHSDLYTDENPKGTIHGLKFATVQDAKDSVKKIESSGKTHAHKIQAAIAMEQRARVMGKTGPADVYRAYINKMKKITKQRNEDFSQRDVNDLEKFADRILAKYGIDVEFTRHFVDRLNDPRNSPEIKVSELQRFFKKIQRNKGRNIINNPDTEAVLKDMSTNLNLPVVIKTKGNGFEVTNKTIMRKPDFKTTSKVLRYEGTKSQMIDYVKDIAAAIRKGGFENIEKYADKFEKDALKSLDPEKELNKIPKINKSQVANLLNMSFTEKAPNTQDAMKRYKAGKAGFTDKAHLKAKGLIPRADGTKRKSDKYK